MNTYILLSRVSPEAAKNPASFKELAQEVSKTIRRECPNIHWQDSFATMGPYDVVDVIQCDDPLQVAKAVTIIRTMGHSVTETMQGTPWTKFLDSL